MKTIITTLFAVLAITVGGSSASAQKKSSTTESYTQIAYKNIKVDGLNIAYREAGNPANPKLVLLHGFPAGSHQYRELIRSLADKFYVISPDYPGFGLSDMPDPATYAYSFDGISLIVEHFLQIKIHTHSIRSLHKSKIRLPVIRAN